MGKVILPMEINHHTKEGVVRINAEKCKIIIRKGKPPELLVFKKPENGKHIHIYFSGAVITSEKERGTDKEHVPLTKKNFDKFKKNN